MRLNHHMQFLKDMLFHRPRAKDLKELEMSLTPSEKLRLDHYIQLTTEFTLGDRAVKKINPFKKTGYSYDFTRCMWELNTPFRFNYKFGDVRTVPDAPTFVKSRPITSANTFSILLPLDTTRHLKFVEDNQPFESKIDQAVFRGACYQPWRKAFMQTAANESLVNAGDTARSKSFLSHRKSFLTVEAQMRYKFIISLEGNDVASNLKWAMNSNSVVLMPKPKFETWFCESHLVKDQHYVELNDDFSNLRDVLEDLLAQPNRCKEITNEAHVYCEEYHDLKRQFQLGALVMHRYNSLQIQETD